MEKVTNLLTFEEQIIIKLYNNGMKYSEIAKKIGLSKNGFHYRLRKAMRKVKSYLKDEGIE